MKVHELHPDPGAHKEHKRVGRGISAGQGKTAGRGTKGQDARTGGGKAPYFEGGQLPLIRRLPFKRGFTNIFKITYQEVKIERLAEIFKAGAVVTPETLHQHNLIKDLDKPIVILGNGELAVALKVSAHRLTKSASDKITAAGGTVTKLELTLKGARATVKLLRKDQRPK